MKYIEAIEWVNKGHRLTRTVWSDDIKFIALIPELSLYPLNEWLTRICGKDGALTLEPVIGAFRDHEHCLPGWRPSLIDIESEDWTLI